MNKNRLPAKRCVICTKTIDEIGGYRIIAGLFQRIYFANRSIGGGNPKYPDQSIKIDENNFIVLRGEKKLWTDEIINRIKLQYLENKRPWFCQVCGNRTCRICNKPINYPMGSDVIYENGCSNHIAIFPFDPGCINSNCEKYKEFSFDYE